MAVSLLLVPHTLMELTVVKSVAMCAVSGRGVPRVARRRALFPDTRGCDRACSLCTGVRVSSVAFLSLFVPYTLVKRIIDAYVPIGASVDRRVAHIASGGAFFPRAL
jgi:hypothetical protein